MNSIYFRMVGYPITSQDNAAWRRIVSIVCSGQQQAGRCRHPLEHAGFRFVLTLLRMALPSVFANPQNPRAGFRGERPSKGQDCPGGDRARKGTGRRIPVTFPKIPSNPFHGDAVGSARRYRSHAPSPGRARRFGRAPIVVSRSFCKS